MESETESETEFVQIAEETVHTRASRAPKSVKAALEKARAVRAQKAQAKKVVTDLKKATTKAKSLASKSRTEAIRAETIALANGLSEPVLVAPKEPDIAGMLQTLQKQVETLAAKPAPPVAPAPPVNTVTFIPEPVPESKPIEKKPRAKRVPKPKQEKPAPVAPIVLEKSMPPAPLDSFQTVKLRRQQEQEERAARVDELRRRLGRY